MTDEKLTDGEVTGGSVTTDVFPILFRTYRNPRFARRITGASSAVARCGEPIVSGDGEPRQALLWHLQTLAKLYDVD